VLGGIARADPVDQAARLVAKHVNAVAGDEHIDVMAGSERGPSDQEPKGYARRILRSRRDVHEDPHVLSSLRSSGTWLDDDVDEAARHLDDAHHIYAVNVRPDLVAGRFHGSRSWTSPRSFSALAKKRACMRCSTACSAPRTALV
jgi:hypothetical protein